MYGLQGFVFMAINVSKPVSRSRDSRLRRHNRALMDLIRLLWHDSHDLEYALTAITETAADVLETDRVNVWQMEAEGLRCVHDFARGGRVHNRASYGEFIALDNSAYAAALPQVRVIRADDVAAAELWGPLRQYIERHGIQSILDAPVRTSGEMYGVICHEQVGAREWKPDEIAFAANMGDFVALAVEIQRRKRAEAELDYMKLHDPVTGLGNRTLFHGAVEHLLRRLQWRPWLAALLFVNIDRFYSVNTSIGEAGGDAMLTTLGQRISVAVPEHAVVARVESDCFGVLLPRLQHEWEAARVAEDIIATVAELMEQDPQRFDIGTSIGVAFTDGHTGTSAEELLRNADFASKQSKLHGRNSFEVFDPDQHRSLTERLRLEHALRDAFKHKQFVVAYQPEIDASSGLMVAAEALLRWRQPDGSLRVADEFIDVAEASGLIVPIGWWVLGHACRAAVAWPVADGGGAPVLRVNLSARQFEQPDLAERVAAILRESGLPPQRLCLELTETTLMTRAESALDTLIQLRELGVSLAIDDFGTGYSSLTYLKRFPVDTLKIDRSFVEGLPDSEFDLALIQTVIALADTLGIDVVAEGVERHEQQRSLQRLGVRRMQGWLYTKALEQPALMEFAVRSPARS